MKGKGLSYLIVGPFAIVLAYPFYVMVITAFKDQTEFYDPSINPYWFGKHSPTLSNASFLFHHTPYPRWLGNTAIVGLCVVGITLAAKGKSDLAVSVVKNSVAQIAVFLFPALVLCSLAFGTHLTFLVGPVFIGALVVTAIAMWQVTGDGEALLFEGAALVAMYVILATLMWFE